MRIAYSLLDQRHLEAAFDLASKVFVEQSTLHQALGIELTEYRDYLRPGFEAMIAEGLSVCAIDRDTDEIVGCLTASDFSLHLQTTVDHASKLAPLHALTKALRMSYLQHRSIKPGYTVLFDMGVIAPNAHGNGIYQKLRLFAQDHAKSLGFRLIVAELSSAATQHVALNKLGHRSICEVNFSNFTYDKAQPFRNIPSPASIVLAEGHL